MFRTTYTISNIYAETVRAYAYGRISTGVQINVGLGRVVRHEQSSSIAIAINRDWTNKKKKKKKKKKIRTICVVRPIKVSRSN